MFQCRFSQRYRKATKGLYTIGTGPSDTKLGDLVCLLVSCSIPLMLRKTGDDYQVIGDVLRLGGLSESDFVRLHNGTYQTENITLC
jgi:hypothetical protein